MPRALFAAVAALGLVGSTHASVTLSAKMVADDLFSAYLSTSSTLQGDEFLSGASFSSLYNGSTVISTPGTYYLHIIAADWGAQRMLIGDFTLSSLDATFANGTQSLSTNITDWTVSDVALGISAVQPSVQPNGWGAFVGISDAAEYIWHPGQPATAYFSTPIVVVPAPSFAGLLGASTLVLARRRRAAI